MTLDNMTGITEGSYTGFCKSQLITCNFVKACNGVCPFEDAPKHADKTQTMNDQHTVDHDRDWIIGCIEHDGFIHTHRFDKANQIIHDALSADTSSDLISRANAIRWVKTECNPYGKPTLDYDSGLKVIEHLKKMPSADAVQGWIPFTRRPMTEEEQKDYPNCTFMFDCVLPDDGDEILVSNGRFVWMDTFCNDIDGCYLDGGDDIDEDMAWMPLPKPYKGGEE